MKPAPGASIYEAVPDRVAVGFSKSGVKDLVRELHGNGQEVVIASDRNALPEMLALGKELGIAVFARQSHTMTSTTWLLLCMSTMQPRMKSVRRSRPF